MQDSAIEELEGLTVLCELINDEYRDYRDSQMNDTLFLLTSVRLCPSEGNARCCVTLENNGV